MNAVESRLDMIDMGPEKEMAFRQARDGNTGMMKREQFFRTEFFLAIKKVAIDYAE